MNTLFGGKQKGPKHGSPHRDGSGGGGDDSGRVDNINSRGSGTNRQRTRKGALRHDNSAVNCNQLVCDPRKDMLMCSGAGAGAARKPHPDELVTQDPNHNHNHNRVAHHSTSDGRRRLKRFSLIDMQQNSAVNVNPLARDPRAEMGGRAADEDNNNNDNERGGGGGLLAKQKQERYQRSSSQPYPEPSLQQATARLKSKKKNPFHRSASPKHHRHHKGGEKDVPSWGALTDFTIEDVSSHPSETGTEEDEEEKDTSRGRNSAVNCVSIIRDPRMERPSFNERRRASQESVASRESEEESLSTHQEEEVITRPSEPSAYRRRKPNRSSGFDVHVVRASLMSRLQNDSERFLGKGGDGVEQGQKHHSNNYNSHANRRTSRSMPVTQGEYFKSSLRDCLGDMGFDKSDIEMAIECTNANSSDDAFKVVEWLGDRCSSHVIEEEDDEEEEELDISARTPENTTSSYSFDEETQYTKQTNHSAYSAGTTNTNETEESNERVQDLKESMKDLGFSREDIKRSKEIYRRHSNEMDTGEFISAMLEVESDRLSSTSDTPASAPLTGGGTTPRKRNKMRHEQKSALVNSIKEMGFDHSQISSVIDNMQESGAAVDTIDVDRVLGVLLNGSDGVSSNHDENPGTRLPCENQPSSRHRRNTDRHAANQVQQQRFPIKERGHDRNTVSTSEPMAHCSTNPDCVGGGAEDAKKDEAAIGSIEITPGQYAQLLKGRQTWNAMHNGMAVSVACIICTVTLKCCPEADYVLCPDCNVVSPLPKQSVSTRRNDMGNVVGSVGLGYRQE